METNNKKLPENHFQRDLIWNLASTVILAIGGLLFSVLIALFYDPETLGVFNQAYAYYILFSQFAVLGVHMATAKYTAELNDSDESARLLSTGILCVSIISLACILLIGGFLLVTKLAFRGDVFFATLLTLAALPLFSINKVALSYLNGLGKMRMYAVLQALRPILIVGTILFCSLMHYPGKYLSASFFVAELILVVVFALYALVRHIPAKKPDLQLAKQLLRFGVSIFPGNLILEFNTKIDVICLGLITGNDYLVGVYSFAALFAEGFYQLFVVVRRIINPKITRMYAENHTLGKPMDAIVQLIQKYLRFGAPLSGILILFVYYAACYILKREPYLAAMLPLAILSISIALNSKSISFGNILSDTGKPTIESMINLIAATSNVVFNCILIPFFGLTGAAIATGISYFVYTIAQRKLVKKHLNYIL